MITRKSFNNKTFYRAERKKKIAIIYYLPNN